MLYISYAGILILSIDSQIFPALLSQIKSTSLRQGILLSALFILFPFAASFVGWIAERIGKKAILISGSIFMALPFFVASLTGSFWILTLAVLFFGIGMGSVEGQTTALISDTFPGKERSLINISQIFFSLGAAGGPFLITFSYLIFPSLKLSAIYTSAWIITVLLAIGFTLVKTREATHVPERKVKIRDLLSDRTWKLLALSLFLYVSAESGTVSWLAKYGYLYLKLPAGIAPICITLFWAGLGISRLIVGTAFHGMSNRKLLILSLSFTLLFQFLTFGTLNPFIALLSILFLGIGMGPIWPTLVSVAGSNYRGANSFAVGSLVAMGGLAMSLIQPIIGFLSRESLLGLRGTLLSLSLLTVVNMILLGKPGHKETVPEAP